MKRLVGQHQQERRGAALLEEAHGALGENIRHVARHAGETAVFKKLRVRDLALALHRDPIIEARPRSGIVAHVPLADKAGVVAGRMERPRKRGQRVAARAAVSVVEDTVVARFLAGEDVGAARGTERRDGEEILELRALARDAIKMGRARERVAGGAEIVETQIVDDHEQDVGPGLGGEDRRGHDESGEGREPRTR